MDASILRRTLDLLLADEDEEKIQAQFDETNAALKALAEDPQDADAQLDFSAKLDKLEHTLREVADTYAPASWERIEAIRAAKFFHPRIVEEIRGSIRENGLSPAVPQERLQDITDRRFEFIVGLKGLRDGLESLGIQANQLEQGQAEIGFKIPRDLFSNELEGLVHELREVRLIIRAFSEITQGRNEKIEVRTISTTDPIFYFGLRPETIIAIGAAVTWALDSWKRVEEVRKIRVDAERTRLFTREEMSLLDNKISDVVRAGINERIAEMFGDTVAGRKAEQRNAIELALQSLFARIERGLSIEIRSLPPPTPEGSAENLAEEPPEFRRMRELREELRFPPPDPNPVLRLPNPPPESAPRPKRSVKPKGARPKKPPAQRDPGSAS